ncbi:amidase [Anaerobacillus alkaliphilus]|uniref:Amidase n=1 Tax=Anaerobacillus alkaliphilus TaxID=1548597 RepID=A0A4Q0VP14_9BACI|nr:amidase family protein [Anaerobacillus alkaliphilus]RXI97771.1 amidase [Anaerobacillus alkaliphilus]
MLGESYTKYDGLGLAELVKTKQVKTSEIIEEAIKQIETQNPRLNAVIDKFYDQNKTVGQSHEMAGPFAGVPFLVKNITQEVKGERITSGSQALKTYIAKQDSEYVRRIRKAGSIFLGSTNVPELALMAITEPKLHGPSRNPWNEDYSPGGSSGGAAAAVASGMVPIAGANDGGGSIRIPAAYCGLFGLKPTRGRTPVGPTTGRNWQGASVDHILSRSVRDSAAMLDVLAGNLKGAAFHAPEVKESYLGLVNQPLNRKCRIAYTVRSPLGTDVHPECKKAVMNTVKLLEEMGHVVEEKEAPIDGRKIANSYLMLYFGEVAATLAELEAINGRKVKLQDVEPTTWLLGLIGRTVSAGDFVMSLKQWDLAAFAMENFHETYDFYITPTTAFPPAKIGELELSSTEQSIIGLVSKLGLTKLLLKSNFVDRLVETSLMRTPFTQLANLTGQPAMSLPLHLTEDGLPCGVQFMASRGREDLLIQLARTFEETPAWIPLRPILTN